MSSKSLVLGLMAGVLGVGAGLGADHLLRAGDADPDLKPAVNLPLTRVVLFNSGVGYFSRSGEVEGDARVDLMFPETDVNDLLKSLVLEDFGRGYVSAVSYDSREPIARTLSSFAINLNGNPTFAGIVGQMRGERVELSVSPGAANQPGKLTGAIVGVDHHAVPAGQTSTAVEVLTLWCAEGMRAVRFGDIQSLRFSNPVIESEFRRALDVLATGHDSQKKAVQLHFAGAGKRKVQVGYVIEAPIWKTSYRLILDENQKPYLQGWAMVENPTDEDWTGVKMALVSGRPISFKMDLYNPLYVDRPVVEPELFASLRPVAYSGDRGSPARVGRITIEGNEITQDRVILNEIGYKFDTGSRQSVPSPFYGNSVTQLPSLPSPQSVGFAGLNNGGGALGGMAGLGGNAPGFSSYGVWNGASVMAPTADGRTEAQRRQPALDVGRELGARMGTGAVSNAATAAALGDSFQYTIDHPVTLARQKSALLPIVGKDIEGSKVSIYNEAVQPKHPLLGLRFKNTSGAHLNQGPITVYEGSVYAGDTRVLDVQPNEERLLSYAIDLGIEVDPKAGAGAQKITSVKAVKGIVTTVTRVTDEKIYRIVNRSQTDRTLLIEHPNRTREQFKLVGIEKPVEDTPDVYRFQTGVKAGKAKPFRVKEERDVDTTIALTNGDENQIRYFLSLSEASPALKQKLEQALLVKAAWDGRVRELNQVNADLQRLNGDQERIRKNLRETPKEADVYATYLKKLSDQEKEIDGLTAKQKGLMSDEFAARKTYEEFLANIDG